MVMERPAGCWWTDGWMPWNAQPEALIPNCAERHRCAHSRIPIDMIFQGWSMRLFQA